MLPPGIQVETQHRESERLLLRAFKEALRDNLKCVEFENILTEMKIEGTLERFISLTLPELSGDTLLHRAVRMGKGKIVSILLRYGAKIYALNARGFNAIQTAKASQNLSIAKALEFSSIHKRLKTKSKRRGKSLISAVMGADPIKSEFPNRLRMLGMRRLAELERNSLKRIAHFGEQIIRQNDESDGFMILIRGTVAIEKTDIQSGGTLRLAVLRPVSVFGHYGPHLSVRRTSNVVALETVVYLFVSLRVMDKLNVRWNGKLFEILDGVEYIGVSRKIKFRTRRNTKQLSTQFLDSGLSCATILKKRRPTLPVFFFSPLHVRARSERIYITQISDRLGDSLSARRTMQFECTRELLLM